MKPETTRSMAQAKQLLAEGVSTEVDLKSGLLVELGRERRTKFTDFHWLEKVGPEEFSTEGQTWDDCTNDPTAGNREELLMIGHNALWRPGMKPSESDGRLLDLETGRVRAFPSGVT